VSQRKALGSTLAWRKASTCGIEGGCVEVAQRREMLIRDSKDPEGPVLRYTEAEWAAFVNGVKNGDFDDWR
jgi:hypothetical protein